MFNRKLYSKIIKKFVFSKEFIFARIICYAVIVILFIVMLFFDPFNYACNQEGYRCITCGIKTGIYYLMKFQFQNAMNSNISMPYLFIIGLIILADIICSVIILLRYNNTY